MEGTLSNNSLEMLKSELGIESEDILHIDLETGKVSSDPSSLGATKKELALVQRLTAYVIEDIGPHVKSVIFFGSIARGEGRRTSDYDLLVEQSKSSLEDSMDLEISALESVLSLVSETKLNIQLQVVSPAEYVEAYVKTARKEGIYLYGG